jgi:arylsulfatase A-like enzyme
MKELMNEGRLERRDDVSPEMLTSLEEQYDTAIHHTSHELARFFDALAERGLWDDLLVVLTSDHGEELFDHGGFAHRYSLYREVLHVPLFVKLPGQREARTVREPVSIVDLVATLHELLGLAVPPGDGASLAPLLGGRGAAVPEALRDRPFIGQASNRKRFVGSSIRQGDEQLIVTTRSWDGRENEVELFDLQRDPLQQRDLSAARPDRVQALRDRLERIRSERAREGLPRQRYGLPRSTREVLEALGYLPDEDEEEDES